MSYLLNITEHGGVAVARGRHITKIDPEAHTATLDDGSTIKYEKCLIATGGQPRTVPEFDNAPLEVQQRTTLFRGICLPFDIIIGFYR